MQSAVLNPWEALESFKDAQFDRLYRNSHSALAIFNKRISELAQSIVMTMLHVPRPIAKSDLEIFVGANSARAYNQALADLQQYRMLKRIQLGGIESFFLTHDFAKSLKKALSDDKTSNSCCEAIKFSKVDPLSTSELDDYAALHIDKILRFIVEPHKMMTSDPEVSSAPPQSVIDILVRGKIVAISDIESNPEQFRISGTGFSFILEKLDTQLWSLIFLYIRSLQTGESDDTDLLSFIFLVASLEPGSAYSTINLSKVQMNVLEFLSILGVVCLNRRQDSTSISSYVPTRLATILVSEIEPKSIGEDSPLTTFLNEGAHPRDGFVIVDTTFQLTAHVSSSVQTALLMLFADLDPEQSNIVTGRITRSSILTALKHGISSQQVISYITTYAHPKMRATARQQRVVQGSRVSVLPTTVKDQIKAWASEYSCANLTAELLPKDFDLCLKCELSCGCANEARKTLSTAPTMEKSKPQALSVIGSA